MQRPTSGKPFSIDIKLLQTACISLLSAQVPLLAATLPLELHAPAAIAQEQSAEAIRKIAQAITVRIEGATQGSGVLVKREGNRYTVLTAWHVVSGQRPGEETAVVTREGKYHSITFQDIHRIGESDSALLSFTSESDYEVARLASGTKLPEVAYLAGYPMGSTTQPWVGRFILLGHSRCQRQRNNGDLVYQRSSETKKQYNISMDGEDRVILNKDTDARIGVSGGPILLADGSLIGHHNSGLGFGNGSGGSIKFGLNRGSTISIKELAIENSYKPQAICALIDSYEASASGNFKESLDDALVAYNLDRKIFGALHDALLTAALQTGRVEDTLCPIHKKGDSISLTGIENICRTEYTTSSPVERIWDWRSDHENPYLCGENPLFTENNRRTWFLCSASSSSDSSIPKYRARWLQLTKKDGVHRPLLIFYELPRKSFCKGGDVVIEVGYATETETPPISGGWHGGAPLPGVANVSATIHDGFAPMIESIAPAIYKRACLEAGLNATWERLDVKAVEANQLYELGFLRSPWANKFTQGPKRGQSMF